MPLLPAVFFAMRLSGKGWENNMKKTYETASDEELVARYQSGEFEIASFLLKKHQPLIEKCTHDLFLKGAEHDDLVQEGRIGLLQAMEKYDPSYGAKFTTYASLIVRGSMIHAVEKANTLYNSLLNSSLPLTEETDRKIDARNESPENEYLDNENAREFYHRLNSSLSPFEKEVLQLLISGLSPTRIASLIGCSAKKIYNTLYRLRNKAQMLVK